MTTHLDLDDVAAQSPLAQQQLAELRELADSEGTRAVEYLRRARLAEAEVQALKAGAQWQPIETAAPSALAGQILTFRNYGGIEESYPVARGNHGPWFQTSFWSPKFNLWVGWPLNVQPTHWMPLPALPTDTAMADPLAAKEAP